MSSDGGGVEPNMCHSAQMFTASTIIMEKCEGEHGNVAG
jgi:hypothetical protein